jgi:ferredoxin-NADP reductase
LTTPPTLEWQLGTVTRIITETPRTKTLTVSLPHWIAHQPGQHYDVRLTAPDGYQAERSYSVASPPERVGEVDLTVELIDDGEVSPYLHDVLVTGDPLELRGPIGGYFVWDVAVGGPLLLVGGGSGVVPLMSMLRHRAARASRIPTRLLYSTRSPEDLMYRDELEQLGRAGDGLEVVLTYTRQPPDGWTGFRRRIDPAMLRTVTEPLGENLRSYVCGPTPLVENVADALAAMGIPADRIRTERFVPTGT